MRSVTYSMGVSLDGYIVGPDGGFDWTAPDEEVFRFVTDEIRQVGVHLAFRSFPSASAGWISNSPRPAPTARESSTSATAWRANRLVRPALTRPSGVSAEATVDQSSRTDSLYITTFLPATGQALSGYGTSWRAAGSA